MNESPRVVPARYKFGFLVGALALCVVSFSLIVSRSHDAMPPVEDAPPQLKIAAGTFSRGVTIYDVLRQTSLKPRQIQEISGSLKKNIDARALKDGDRYALSQSMDGEFHELTITRQFQEYVVSRTTSNALTVSTRRLSPTVEERTFAGHLAGTLWESMRGEDMTPELTMQFADIFAWNLDFLTEPREGDRYALAWTRESTPQGEVVNQKILAALYEGRATGRHVAILYKGDYYDAGGNSVRKAFLHAPLNFRRISSGFALKRFHPILRYFRPHLGIDYAAPTGTPVVSVGDGVVVYKGWKTAYGRYVQVRHNGEYSTCYGHFSRFSKKIARGGKVKQGQVIGYVGASGWATGPHLDFRVMKNGRFVNFLKLKFPAEKKISPSEKAEFEPLAKQRLQQLENLISKQDPPVS